MELKICPYCNKDLLTGKAMASHLRKHNTTYGKALKDVYIKNIPKEILEKFPEDCKTMSLPDFKEKYGLQYDQTQNLYKIFNIKPRTLKEAVNTQTKKEKTEQTCLKKYGDTNVLGRKSPLYKKRNETVKRKYGVDNVFQIEEVKKAIKDDFLWLKKYGLSYKEFKSQQLKKSWASLSLEQKREWLEKSIFSNKKGPYSNLELCVGFLLAKEGLAIQTSYALENIIKEKTKNHIFIYDIYLKELNLIIEVNGDYWHANPKKYNSDDILPFYSGEIEVKKIWEKDAEKQKNAEKQGYKFVTLWESDIVKNVHYSGSMTEENLIREKILKVIYENC